MQSSSPLLYNRQFQVVSDYTGHREATVFRAKPVLGHTLLGFAAGFGTESPLALRSSSSRFARTFSCRNRGMGGGLVPLPAAFGGGGFRTQSRLKADDGVVIVDHGSRRAESNVMLHEFVKMYKEKTSLLIVEAAHMELAAPTISDAFDRCVGQGAKRIIISPYFLFPGRHWDKDIPALAAEAAKKHPRVPYLVTAPIGLHELMVTVINDRMEYCLSQVAGEVSECGMCEGSGRCKQLMSQEFQSSSDSVGSSSRNLSSG